MAIQASNFPSPKDQRLLEDYERNLSLLDGLSKNTDLQKEKVTRLKERVVKNLEASKNVLKETESLKNRVTNQTPQLARFVSKEKSGCVRKILNKNNLRCISLVATAVLVSIIVGLIFGSIAVSLVSGVGLLTLFFLINNVRLNRNNL